MCGIIARVSVTDGVDELVSSLENLEYRGYDSAGIAVKNGSGIEVVKREGEIDRLKSRLAADRPDGAVGIGHTRWSTHGPPSDENAHPHTDCSGDIAVVHNGIIENHDELRDRLRERGHTFTSETDTEVVPHLMEESLRATDSVDAAFRGTIRELAGSYAIAMIVDGHDAVYATRNGSPLVLGVDDGRYFLASDVPAFLEYTDVVVHLDDGDVVAVSPDGHAITDLEGNEVDHSREVVDWDPQDAGRGGYDHYMLKEIHEQPTALRQTVRGRVDTLSNDVTLDSFPPDTFSDVRSVQFVAAGTSYHAAMYGARMLADYGIPVQAFLANEYATTPPPIDDGTLVVAVSQSGETADTLAAIRRATAAGVRTAVVTNVVGSTAVRETDDALYIRAGPEIGVAATKTFSSQVAALTLLAERLARDVNGTPSAAAPAVLEALSDIPKHVQQVLDETQAEAVARTYEDSQAYFFIGRGAGFPVALEGALKFKEISYEHAEGFSAGELKHGPLALVTSETPVFAVFTGQHVEKTLSNVKEVQSRGAPVVAVGDPTGRIERFADDVLRVPESHPYATGVLANVQLQLVAYYAARRLGRPVDKPRNLAKSVTVE